MSIDFAFSTLSFILFATTYSPGHNMSKYSWVNRVIGLPRSNEDVGSDTDEEFLLKEESGPQTPAKKSFFQRHFIAINVHSSLILFYLIIGATILAQGKDNSCTPHYVASKVVLDLFVF